MKINLFIILFSLFTLSDCKKESAFLASKEIETIENGLLLPIQEKGKEAKKYNILDRMKHHKVPGVSIAVVQNGALKWAKGYGIANTETGKKVDENTLFQAGSISKPVAALAALKLVENGIVLLDQDVNTYLKDWKVKENAFTKDEKVTLRRLLTHTAGVTVHGFPGYTQKDEFPTIESVLNGEGNTDPIALNVVPGTIWRYSGGGYTIMEKMVEDVTGKPFEIIMAKKVLDELEMNNSTYEQPLPKEKHSNASAAYDGEGKIIEGLWHNYPEQAAAGLWTTPTDLAKYCMAIQKINKGEKNGVLRKKTIDLMLTKHKNDWGLGPSLKNTGSKLRFQHGGKNAGFTNDMVAYAKKGDAVIIMTNADNGGKLISEIQRSVSAYYGWDIEKPRVVTTKKLPTSDLNQLTGKYKLDFQVPDIGDYLIDITVENEKIKVYDPNNKDINYLTPLAEKMKFIDLDKGDEVKFSVVEGKVELLWNGKYRFIEAGK